MMRLQIAAYSSVVLALLLAVDLGFLTWQNGSSRNLALAYAALIGVLVATGTQAVFDLRSKSSTTHLAASYTLDRKGPVMAQVEYSLDQLPRGELEYLATSHVLDLTSLPRDRVERAASELAKLSILGFIITNPNSWGSEAQTIRLRHGTASFSTPLDPGRCRSYTIAEVQQRLSLSSDIIKTLPSLGQTAFCLPPGAELSVDKDNIRIENEVVLIQFTVGRMIESNNRDPLTLGEQREKVQGGLPRYQSVSIALDLSTTIKWAAAQSRDLESYDKWLDSLRSGLSAWFDPMQLKAPPGSPPPPTFQPFNGSSVITH